MVGVTAENGLIWLLLGKTSRKEFGFDADEAHKFAEALDMARNAAELQQLGPPLGLVCEMNIRSHYGKVWLVLDCLVSKVPVSRDGAKRLADMMRFKAGQAEFNLEVLVKGGN